jgi:hypothetical protein
VAFPYIHRGLADTLYHTEIIGIHESEAQNLVKISSMGMNKVTKEENHTANLNIIKVL